MYDRGIHQVRKRSSGITAFQKNFVKKWKQGVRFSSTEILCFVGTLFFLVPVARREKTKVGSGSDVAGRRGSQRLRRRSLLTLGQGELWGQKPPSRTECGREAFHGREAGPDSQASGPPLTCLCRNLLERSFCLSLKKDPRPLPARRRSPAFPAQPRNPPWLTLQAPRASATTAGKRGCRHRGAWDTAGGRRCLPCPLGTEDAGSPPGTQSQVGSPDFHPRLRAPPAVSQACPSP